jgi:hypothetical protein
MSTKDDKKIKGILKKPHPVEDEGHDGDHPE